MGRTITAVPTLGLAAWGALRGNPVPAQVLPPRWDSWDRNLSGNGVFMGLLYDLASRDAHRRRECIEAEYRWRRDVINVQQKAATQGLSLEDQMILLGPHPAAGLQFQPGQ